MESVRGIFCNIRDPTNFWSVFGKSSGPDVGVLYALILVVYARVNLCQNAAVTQGQTEGVDIFMNEELVVGEMFLCDIFLACVRYYQMHVLRPGPEGYGP